MRRAFTTVELLAATALTAVLMVAVLHVIGSIGRNRAALMRQQGPDPAHAAVLDALRWDLTHARSARFAPGRLTLSGYGAADRDTLAPRHLPATVVYEAVTVAGRRWLVRRQAPRDALAGRGEWSELLCADALRFTAEPARPPQGGTARAATRGVPPAVRVRIDLAGGTSIDEVVVW